MDEFMEFSQFVKYVGIPHFLNYRFYSVSTKKIIPFNGRIMETKKAKLPK